MTAKATTKPEPTVPVAFWKNRQNGAICRVVPWWEILEPILADDKVNGAVDLGTHLTEGRKFKMGCLVQVGWLLETEGGVWVGVSMRGKECFDEIKPPKKWPPKKPLRVP